MMIILALCASGCVSCMVHFIFIFYYYYYYYYYYQYSKDWGAGCKDPSFASEGFCWETMHNILSWHNLTLS